MSPLTQKIVELRLAGSAPLEIAVRLNLRPKRVRRKLSKFSDRYDFPPLRDVKPPKFLSPEEKASAVREYLSGMSTAEVGRKYDVSATTVANIVKGAGFKTRNQAESHAKYRKKHCKRGHELHGSKKCSQCVRERAAGLYRKKFCKWGHPRTDDNLYGLYGCKTCHAAAMKRSYLKHREARLAYLREYSKTGKK